MARTLSVEGNNYTSQLNVTVTPDTAGKTIECAHDDARGNVYYLFTLKIPTVTGLSLHSKPISYFCLNTNTYHNRATKHTKIL